MSGTAAVLRDSKGNVVGAIESIRDVTDRRRMEEALKESEERYGLIFDHAPLGIVHFDHEGVIQDFNGKFEEIIGAPRERHRGFDMLRDVQEPAMRQAVEDALAGELGYFEGACRSCHRWSAHTDQGHLQTHHRGPTGRFLGGVGLIEDIAERKRAEEEHGMPRNPTAPAPEDGSGGDVGGGDRPRLQQYSDGHCGLHRNGHVQNAA